MRSILRLVAVAGIAVQLAACSSSGPPPPELANPSLDVAKILDVLWEWEGTVTPEEERTIEDPSRYTLRFEPGVRVAIRADCNRGYSKYEINGYERTLRIDLGMMTRAKCPPDTEDFIFLREVQDVGKWQFDGRKLMLELKSNAATMRFRPIPIESGLH